MTSVKRCIFSAMAASAAGLCVSVVVAAEPEHASAGQAVHDKWCAPCHDPGIFHPGTHALMVKYAGSKPAVLKEWTDLDPFFLRYTVRHGVSVMPHFRKTEITDAELDALVAYLARPK